MASAETLDLASSFWKRCTCVWMAAKGTRMEAASWKLRKRRQMARASATQRNAAPCLAVFAATRVTPGCVMPAALALLAWLMTSAPT